MATPTETQAATAAATQKPTADTASGEVHTYQAEMQQLLHIIVHSLYSEREIFLRELISNASDALNRLKFESLTRKDFRDPELPLEITLSVDKEANVLTIADTGIGLSRDEMIRNLGTIAKSGTLDWVKTLATTGSGQAGGDAAGVRSEMIGQFGVGFYSVFMVAKQVTVDSCPADPAEAPTRWLSAGGGSYELQASTRTRRGTEIRVELRPECAEFATGMRVEEIVRRYSAFVPHPIRLDSRQLNTQEAIWRQGKGVPSEEQNAEFYKFLTHDSGNPLHAIHLSIDAPVQFRALLFIPKHLTNEILYSSTSYGVRLYAARVLIEQECQNALPAYLRFLRGVVDSEDLPLNVSREVVQKSSVLANLRTTLAGRVLRELKGLADANPVRYGEFWQQYGKVLKEGIATDLPSRDKLLELARFTSSVGSSANELTTLKDYVSRIRDGQREILYFSGPSREAIERNPNLEFFRKNRLEVLYLTDRGVDDFMMAGLHEFEGKPFASIDNADLEAFKAEPFKTIEPDTAGLAPAHLDGLLSYLKETLGERVGAVQLSKRLVESPATLVNPESMPGNLQRVMRMIDREFKTAAKTLEINPGHSLIRNMAQLAALREDASKASVLHDLAEQLLDNCLLVEGQIEHPERMIGRIQEFMTRVSAAAASASGVALKPDAEPPPELGPTRVN
jgi:HSP90 family molecular chaperone